MEKEHFQTVGSGQIPLGADPDKAAVPSSDAATVEQPERPDATLVKELAALEGQVIVGVPSDQLLLRTVHLPLVSDDELGSMVQLQVDKFSPFPVESMVVSHEVLETRNDDCLVLIAAVQEEIAESFGKTLRAAGIVPRRVDAAVLGWWRLLRDAGEAGGKGGHIVLLLSGAAPEIMVLRDGIPIVFRSLGENSGLTEDEFVDETVDEISHTIMSVELEHGVQERWSISLWRRGEGNERLAAALRDQCSCEVTVKSLDAFPSSAEGLARRAAEPDGKKLDMTPAAWRLADKSRSFKRRMLAASAAVFGIWLLLIVGIFGGFYLQQWSVDRLKLKKEELDKPAKKVTEIRSRVMVIKRYMDWTKSPLECLRETSSLQPHGVDMTSFTYRKGEGVKISGEADTVNLVYDFKNSLDGAHFFAGTTLDGPRHDPRKGKEMFNMDLKLPGGEQ